jgi:8-oxo-dGTP pyrophosphatase MutT (NUDIX family)
VSAAARDIDRHWIARRLVGAEHRAPFVPGDVRIGAGPDAPASTAAPAGDAGARAQPAALDAAFERAHTPAGVLVPLIARPAGITVLLTQRAGHLSRHANQIAFPGGRHEAGDGSMIVTALRETEEEVGLPRDRVEVLGVLPEYRTRTGFRITPVVGWIEPPFALAPDPGEVTDVFEIPLAFVLDPANHERHHRDAADERRYFYVLPFEDRYIWGATAAMLINLHHVLAGE